MVGAKSARNALLTVGPNINSPHASAQIGNAEKISAEPGEWVAVRAWAATEQTGEQIRLQIRVGASGEGYNYVARSEERRVGKEVRSGWLAEKLKERRG